MKNTTDDIRFQLEALLRDATLQLKKLHKEENPEGPADMNPGMSVLGLQMRSKSIQAYHHIFEELVVAAYYNANNPDWDPARAETYWTELAEDDPLRQLLEQDEATDVPH